MNLPCAKNLIEMQKLRQALGLTKTNLEESIITSDSFKTIRGPHKVSCSQFAEILMLSPTDPSVQQLFSLCDRVSGCSIEKKKILDINIFFSFFFRTLAESSILESIYLQS